MTLPLEEFNCLPSNHKFSLDQAYEWHRRYSSQAPAFVYPDENGQQFVSWKQLGDAINVGIQYIKVQTLEIIRERASSHAEPLIIAVLSSADHLTFVTFLLSILRLTHSKNTSESTTPILPFLISPRNSPAAVAHLLGVKRVKYVWVSKGPMQRLLDDALKHLQLEEGIPISTFPFPDFAELYQRDMPTPMEDYDDSVLDPVPLNEPAVILHSSGSTAFPKPITITHQMLMEWGIRAIEGNINLKGEISSAQNAPMFHAMGIFITGWAVYSGLIRSVPNPLSSKAPSDPDSFLEEIVKTRTTVVYTVPNFLEAWANDLQAVQILATMKTILWGGGPMSDRTGNYLVSNGVKLAAMYGTTETGDVAYLTESNSEGHEWFQLSPSTQPALIPYSAENNTFELCFKVAEGHHLAVTNTQIDGVPAYATSDLVERHPNRSTLFRIKGRVDDQIMHSNGEKTNPIPIEGLISKNPHVKAAVVFGRGKASTGVIIEPDSYEMAEHLGLEKFRNLIWPTVEDANHYAPAHSRIFKEMIILTSPSKPFPYTAKNTVRRNVAIREYEEEIENAYNAVENSVQTDISPPPVLEEEGGWSFEDARNFVRKVIHSVMTSVSNIMKDEDDIFAFGCDSLQATYIRNTIIHALRQATPSSMVNSIPNNFVYQHPTIDALGEAVFQVSRNKLIVKETQAKVIQRRQRLQDLVIKYTQNWPSHQPQSVQKPDSEVILLTGSTGALGAQMLIELIDTPSVNRVYAFNRASKISVRQRHVEAFTKGGNDLSLLDSEKIIFVEGDTSAKDLDISPELFKEIRDSVTTIMHTAWRVNFNISLISFEPAIRGLRHLIDLALASPHMTPPRVMFTSSIGNVKLWANVPAVPEVGFKDIDLVNPTGYNESKWICEQILETASRETPLKPIIVRVGQLSGGGKNGNWNPREWFPALVKASYIVKAAPEYEGLVSFIPLHTAAKALVELRHSSGVFSNLVHPCPVAWNDVIQWVAERLNIPVISYPDWLRKLESAPRTSETLLHNPALHLLDFYRSAMPPADMSNADFERREAMGIATYETANTIIHAPTLHPNRLSQITRDDVHRWIEYWNLS